VEAKAKNYKKANAHLNKARELITQLKEKKRKSGEPRGHRTTDSVGNTKGIQVQLEYEVLSL